MPRFVYTPEHCSWLNQIEYWFSILSRRLLNKRSDFKSIEDLEQKLRSFIVYYNQLLKKPFQWNFKSNLLRACFNSFVRKENTENSTIKTRAKAMRAFEHDYSSDITREQFAIIQPYLESTNKETKPRDIDLYTKLDPQVMEPLKLLGPQGKPDNVEIFTNPSYRRLLP